MALVAARREEYQRRYKRSCRELCIFPVGIVLGFRSDLPEVLDPF